MAAGGGSALTGSGGTMGFTAGVSCGTELDGICAQPAKVSEATAANAAKSGTSFDTGRALASANANNGRIEVCERLLMIGVKF